MNCTFPMNCTFKDAFRNRRVFVTGHTGFKGSWLTLWLDRLGAQVTGYSLPPTSNPNNFVSSHVEELIAQDYHADVCDFSCLQSAVRESRPDLIIHMAAQALVRASYHEPRETFAANVMGTVNVLDAARSLEHPCSVIIVTSDKCYENSDQQRTHIESDPLGGHDPYSASKAAAEIVTTAYQKSFFSSAQGSLIKVASVRAGNVIGGGDWSADRIVPDAVRALSNGEAIQVRNPHAVRPWQHVLEPLSGYLTLASRMMTSDDPALCSSWNFGPRPEDEATVADLAETFCQAFGKGTWQNASLKNQPAEAQVLRLSSAKAQEKLGWQPRWHFHEAVERTAQWYRDFYARDGRSTRDLCLADIAAYESASSDQSMALHAVPVSTNQTAESRI